MVSVINLGTHLICDRIPGLKPEQKRICREKPQSLPIIINGLRLASEECKRRFQYNRWNCSSLPGRNIFTHHMLRGKIDYSKYDQVHQINICRQSRGRLFSCHPIGCSHFCHKRVLQSRKHHILWMSSNR